MSALLPGVQTRPSFGPPAHLPPLQIGQGWMRVLQLLLGQSASVMQPLPAFAPATHKPDSHVPLAQSGSEQQGAPVSVHRPVSLTQVPPGQAAALPFGHPPEGVQFPPALDPPLHRMAMRSWLRKVCELSGRVSAVVDPVAQSAVPAAFAAARLMMQLLVADPLCDVFGMGSGGPNRQPAFVHCMNLHLPPGQSASAVQELWWFVPPEHRLPPASLGVVPLRVMVVPLHEALVTEVPRSGTIDGSGTPTPEPPK